MVTFRKIDIYPAQNLTIFRSTGMKMTFISDEMQSRELVISGPVTEVAEGVRRGRCQ